MVVQKWTKWDTLLHQHIFHMNPSTLRSCLSRAKKGSSNPKKYTKTNPTKPVSYKNEKKNKRKRFFRKLYSVKRKIIACVQGKVLVPPDGYSIESYNNSLGNSKKLRKYVTGALYKSAINDKDWYIIDYVECKSVPKKETLLHSNTKWLGLYFNHVQTTFMSSQFIQISDT